MIPATSGVDIADSPSVTWQRRRAAERPEQPRQNDRSLPCHVSCTSGMPAIAGVAQDLSHHYGGLQSACERVWIHRCPTCFGRLE